MRLLPIVEGPGDLAAVPVLLRRLLHEVHNRYDVAVARPYRFGNVQTVSRKFDPLLRTAAKEHAPILWTFDCDDGCALEWVRQFEEQMPAGIQVPVEFAFFVREYECIFLAEKRCLTRLGIPGDVDFAEAPESVRGAKGLISRLMPPGTAYKETVHQASLTAALDLDLARQNSRSVRHLESALLKLIA